MIQITEIPNPASKFARVLGCTCDGLKNDFGRGRGIDENGDLEFIVNLNCPVHGSIIELE